MVLSFSIVLIWNVYFHLTSKQFSTKFPASSGSIARNRLSIGTYITVKRLIRSILRRRKKMSNVNANSLVKHQAKASHRDGVIVINGGKKDIKFHLSTKTFHEWSVNELRVFLCRIIASIEIESLWQDVLPNHHQENKNHSKSILDSRESNQIGWK